MFGGRLRRSGTNRSSSSSNSPLDATIASTSYARKVRDLMKLHRDLNALSAGIDLDMPCLTVIGSQSAGKSSLVEAVSGISVPRDSGTCTRCPMECSMSTTEDSWSCKITLRISYAPDGSPSAAKELEGFSPVITNKKDVEIWIRRAQAAILNPHLPSSHFHTQSEKDLKKGPKDPRALRFSKNVVCVHVSDPDLTDLSFVDLPGLIQNSNDEDINLIRDLVVDAISRHNTLILVTIPMSDDMQNQAAVRLARDADPAGERTIGVLTKPDILSSGATGELQNWKDVIEGKSYTLKHGYYCVRLPNETERNRNASRSDMHKSAARFFDTTVPWSNISDRDRFGIPNFVASISGLLVELIEKNLPALRARIRQLLAECNKELEGLPILSISDPSTEVCLRLTQFCQDFGSAVFAEQHKDLAQNNRERYTRFKTDIYRTRPNFVTYDRRYTSSNLEVEKTPSSGLVIDIPQVKTAIAKSMGWELPTHVPFDATKNYILGFTGQWTEPAMSCFQDVYTTISAFITKLMTQHFGQFKNLERHVSSVVQVELERCKDVTGETLKKMLTLESIPVFTQNNEFFFSQRTYWLQHPYNLPLYDIYRNHADYDALSVMADRVIDYVPLTIEHELHQSLANSLQRRLFESLAYDDGSGADHDKMAALFVEDPVLSRKRAFLEDRKRRLKLIKQKLDAFGQGDEET